MESAQGWETRRAEVRRRLLEGDGAASISAELCAALDRELTEAVDRHLPQGWQHRVGVVAVGGYGRREVYPHGDVDLLLLYEDGLPEADPRDPAAAPQRIEAVLPGAQEAIPALVGHLRDARWRLAFRVRSVVEHARLSAEDITVATSGLEARLIAGAVQGLADVPAWLMETGRGKSADARRRSLKALATGMRERHAQYGGSAFMLEPQLKMGRGGLRDVHTLRWASFLCHGHAHFAELVAEGKIARAELEDLEDAAEFVRRARLALHASSKFRTDQLAFERQEEVARLMGFALESAVASIEAFMKSLHPRLDTLANVVERSMAEWDDGRTQEILTLGEGYVLRGGQLDVEDVESLDWDRGVALLLRAHGSGHSLHPGARSALRETAQHLHPRVADRPQARELLRAALLESAGDGYLLRVLLDVGWFRLLVPEWAHLVGHTSHDVYHVYTTDRHLHECHKLLHRVLRDTRNAEPLALRAALDRIAGRGEGWVEPLRLAALFHDIGKAMGGDHSLVGAGLAVEVARRMGVKQEGRARLRWLVREHLRMAKTSQRRDIGDPNTLRRFLESVPDEAHLDALFVLTYVDMSSVGPALQSAWKVALLSELQAQALAFLSEGELSSRLLRERAPLREALAEGRWTEAFVHRLEGELAPRVWASFREDELLMVAELLLRVSDEGRAFGVQLHHRADEGLTTVAICADDRPGLLFALTGTIAAAGLMIVKARIATTRSGRALDVFDIQSTDQTGRRYGAHRWTRLENALESAVLHGVTPSALRAQWTRESQLQERHRPPVETEVAIEAVDAALWVLEVKTRDRRGLLADLAQWLTEFGFEIERSIITQEGDRAIDTFYVRRVGEAHWQEHELCERLRADLLRWDDHTAKHG